MMRAFAVALLALFSGGMAHAGDTPAVPADRTPGDGCQIDGKPVDAALLAAAEDLQAQSDTTGRLSQVIDSLVPSMVEMVKKTTPSASDEALSEFSDEFRKEMKANLPEVLKQTACVAARHYTLADMQQMKAFYATQLGQKMLANGPVMAKEMFTVGEIWGMKTGMSAAHHVLEKLRIKGVKI